MRRKCSSARGPTVVMAPPAWSAGVSRHSGPQGRGRFVATPGALARAAEPFRRIRSISPPAFGARCRLKPAFQTVRAALGRSAGEKRALVDEAAFHQQRNSREHVVHCPDFRAEAESGRGLEFHAGQAAHGPESAFGGGPVPGCGRVREIRPDKAAPVGAEGARPRRDLPLLHEPQTRYSAGQPLARPLRFPGGGAGQAPGTEQAGRRRLSALPRLRVRRPRGTRDSRARLRAGSLGGVRQRRESLTRRRLASPWQCGYYFFLDEGKIKWS